MRQRSFMPLFHRSPNRGSNSDKTIDDADAAAGQVIVSSSSQNDWLQQQQQQQHQTVPAPLSNASSLATMQTAHAPDLEFFEDLIAEPVVLVLGMDISHYDRQLQFTVCASGVFMFSLLYGYLQELLSVELCSRQLGLFLAMMQFMGYTILAFCMRTIVYNKQQQRQRKKSSILRRSNSSSSGLLPVTALSSSCLAEPTPKVPLQLYFCLSLLRAVDLGMTNLAMQYINYPAKTLMKSSRIVFTMLFGVLLAQRRYKCLDYAIVLAMVAGLALFMHADAHSSAVFELRGVLMLTVSLVCDGAISNMSERIMSQYGVGQDEFIFRMYSIALVAISLAAAYKGDLQEGVRWMAQPGTYAQVAVEHAALEDRTWSVSGKLMIMVLFSSMGFFGSSCSAAITKNFGALVMSMTSTARKATTLFLSFFFFNNVCTMEHVAGMILFITALMTKSLRRGRDPSHHHHKRATTSTHRRPKRAPNENTKNNNDSGDETDSLLLEIPPVVRTRSQSSEGTPLLRSRMRDSNHSSQRQSHNDYTGIHVV